MPSLYRQSLQPRPGAPLVHPLMVEVPIHVLVLYIAAAAAAHVDNYSYHQHLDHHCWLADPSPRRHHTARCGLWNQILSSLTCKEVVAVVAVVVHVDIDDDDDVRCHRDDN